MREPTQKEAEEARDFTLRMYQSLSLYPSNMTIQEVRKILEESISNGIK